jgi:hypothetical protein
LSREDPPFSAKKHKKYRDKKKPKLENLCSLEWKLEGLKWEN